MPRAARWEKDRTERLKILLTEYSKPVREAALKAVESGTKVAYKSVRLGVTGVSVAQDFLLLTKLSGHFGIVYMVAGVGGLAGLVALA